MTADITELARKARRIMRINSAYFQSKVLQSAVEIGLFELLADGPATAEEISERLTVHPRMVDDFLDALVGLELLDRADGRYFIDEDVAGFLVRSGSHYIGGSVVQHGRMHYHIWGQLTEALHDGNAKSNKLDGTAGFKKFYENTEIVRALMDHMDTYTRFVAPVLARCIDWSGHESFIDLGGARGNVSGLVALAHPHLRGAVFDLPPVEPLFDEHMARLGTADRVRFNGGDFHVDAIPETDVAIIGHTLHDWPPEDRQKLIDRTFPSIRPGGALLIYDAMLDDERRDAAAILQSLNCRLLGNGASEYTVHDCRMMIESAGYRFEKVMDTDTITSDKIVVARKAV